MVRMTALNRNEIVSGRELPFSIFDPSHNVMLAVKGQVVTDRLRAALLRSGLLAFAEDDTFEAQPAANMDAVIPPLLQLRMQYARGSAISRCAFRISRGDGSESYTCRVVGLSEQRGLILTAPVRDGGGHVPISEGQTWQFRTLYSTAAIRFAAVIGKVVHDPFPYFHVDVPPMVEMRHVRKVQRVSLCLNAVLRLSHPAEAVIVDMSTTGMQIATDASVDLQQSHRLPLEFRVNVLGKAYDMSVDVEVVRCLGAIDPRHPKIEFYGLGMDGLSDFNRLVLHSFVQGCVIRELDGLSKMLVE